MSELQHCTVAHQFYQVGTSFFVWWDLWGIYDMHFISFISLHP